MHLSDTERELIDAAVRDNTHEVNRLTAIIDAQEMERAQRLARPEALAEAALWYAAHGQPVFPCRVGGKVPATSHGFKDATTDPDRVRSWWETHRGANIGLPTGVVFDVVDLDGPDGLLRFYAEVVDDPASSFPAVRAVALTPHGRHLYVGATGRGNRAGMLPGVDYRGLGGYVVAPPSAAPAGLYRWVRGHEPFPRCASCGELLDEAAQLVGGPSCTDCARGGVDHG